MDLACKKVLVTGADGFIGSHLVEALVARRAKVKALSYYNSFNSWGWLEDISCVDEIEVVSGDVRDPHLCRKISEGVQVIFHLAALVGIPYSYITPRSYVDTNITGTLNVSQAAQENGCERLIQTSTSEVYGTAQYVPINEEHPLVPQSPYSASKIGADATAMSFYHAFGLPVIIARPFNTYGPRQSARAVIPTIITQIASGKKTIRLGDTTPTRDFSYVRDICQGLILLAENEDAVGQVVNIGSNREICIKNLLTLIKALMHSDVQFVAEEQRIRPRASEVLRLWCDNTKLKTLTNFEPRCSLEQGLEKTIEWFRNKLNKYKVNLYNV